MRLAAGAREVGIVDTFVVRIYPSTGSNRPGRIEHVTSGSVLYFHSLDELPRAVEAALQASGSSLQTGAMKDR